MSNFAWVTLTTSDTYSLGALVLAHSLRRTNTAHQLAVMVTPNVSESMRGKLKDVYNVVQEVNVMDSQDAANLALLSRPELGVTFTKLHCWRLVQYEKCVFLDADTLVLQNCDELFEREELSAAPDVSWPDCFNSGVFVFKPSLDTFAKITEYAAKHGSFDGGDQGLLNSYFSDWATSDIKKHLPFIYNVAAYASYCYLPAFKQFRDKIKILHFAGKTKPWLIEFNSETKTAATPSEYAHATEFIQYWWNIFCDNVHPKLTDNMNRWSTVMTWLDKFYTRSYECHDHRGYEFQQQHEQNHHNHHHCHHQDHCQNYQNYQNHHHHHHQSHLPHPCQIDIENVKEFRDPWEDYYNNLEKQSNNNERNAIVEGEGEQSRRSDSDRREIDTSDRNSDSAWPHEYNLGTNANGNGNGNSDKNTNSNSNSNVNANADVNANTETYRAHTNGIGDFDHVSADDHDNANYKDDDDVNRTLRSVDDKVTDKTKRNSNEAGLAGALSQLRLGEHRTPEQEAYEQLMRRQCWESGQIDYAGKDSFDNIWKKISQTLESKPPTPPAPAAATASTAPSAPKEEKDKSGTS